MKIKESSLGHLLKFRSISKILIKKRPILSLLPIFKIFIRVEEKKGKLLNDIRPLIQLKKDLFTIRNSII